MSKFEDGDECPSCFEGLLDYNTRGVCSCHLMAPCPSCTDVFLQCDCCGWEDDGVKDGD